MEAQQAKSWLTLLTVAETIAWIIAQLDSQNHLKMVQASIRPLARILTHTTPQFLRWVRLRCFARLASTIRPLQRRSTDAKLLTNKHTYVQKDQAQFSNLWNLGTSKHCKMLRIMNFEQHSGHKRKIRNKLSKKCTTKRKFFESIMRRGWNNIRTR